MFENSTFESRGILVNRTPKWMLLALTANLTVIATLIVLPLLNPESLPGRLLRERLEAPVPPPAAATFVHTVVVASHVAASPINPILAPHTMPIFIDYSPDPPPTGDLSQLSTETGIQGGNGPVTKPFERTTQPVLVHPATPASIKVSGGVIEGLLIRKVNPTYPPIARAVRLSGTVSLAATISPTGTITNLRVLSGSPMLQRAAIDAVQSWRYRPYLLNGQPVEVETTINVVFSMNGR
jgi:protein TonB